MDYAISNRIWRHQAQFVGLSDGPLAGDVSQSSLLAIYLE
jgi:hypothetical protein